MYAGTRFHWALDQATICCQFKYCPVLIANKSNSIFTRLSTFCFLILARSKMIYGYMDILMCGCLLFFCVKRVFTDPAGFHPQVFLKLIISVTFVLRNKIARKQAKNGKDVKSSGTHQKASLNKINKYIKIIKEYEKSRSRKGSKRATKI